MDTCGLMTNGKNNQQAESGNEQEQLRSLLEAVSQESSLPASGTELILLEVDPHRAHAYWNIDPAQASSSDPLVLRVFDITDSGAIDQASQVFDVEVQGCQGRWYLDLWRDNRTFVTEIGYRQPDGSLKLLARSNEVSTPVAEPVKNASAGQHVDQSGNQLHTDWPGDNVEHAEAALPLQDAAAQESEFTNQPDKPEPVAPLVAEPVTLLNPEFPLPVWSKFEPEAETGIKQEQLSVPAKNINDQPSDTVVAAGDAAVAFAEEVMMGSGDVATVPSAAAVEKVDQAPYDFPTPEELIASVQENHDALKAFYDSAGPGDHDTVPSEGSVSDSHQDQKSDSSSPAPENLPPLEQIVGLSSLEHMSKDVLLEVNAELHIYGRSKPNTELTIYGQIVKTRPDGSFSVRRPLPHGAVVLPLLYTKPEQ